MVSVVPHVLGSAISDSLWPLHWVPPGASAHGCSQARMLE